MNGYQKQVESFLEVKLFTALWKLQYDYMKSVCDAYQIRADTPAKQIILEALKYVTDCSTSGGFELEINDESTAHEVDEIIWEEIGDYLLDYDVYKRDNGRWTLSVNFAGMYVPEWDEYQEEAQAWKNTCTHAE